MKIINVIDGQMDLFNLPSQEPIKPKEEKILIIEKPIIKKNNSKEIINLYEESCNRIIKRISGALLVEFEDRTMYFNSQGINEFNLTQDVGLMPGDEIILANEYKELNDLQFKKLNDMKVTKYIKRKGDSNILISGEKTIVINPKGWVIEYEQKPKYHENELFITETAINITKSVNEVAEFQNDEDEDLQIGDAVEFNYDGPQLGNITSIYNNGETINVSWEGKRTAFYYKCVKKLA